MRKWWPLVAVCLGTFLFLLDTTVLSVALPAIGAALAAPLGTLQWVADSYPLALAVLMLTMGSLADRLGARTLYLAGLAVFGLASLACGLAPSAGALIAARGLQGVGGAAIAVTTLALIGSVYRGPDLGRAMGVFGAVTGLAAAAGPMLGGLLTQYLGWRAVFLLNLPFVAATIVLSARVLESRARTWQRPTSAARLDLPGAATFALCAGSLTYALTLVGRHGWASAPVLGLLLLAALALGAFVRVELGSPAPLLDVRVFARPALSAVLLCVVATTAAFAALVYTSLWLQSTLGLSPVRAGLAMMPLALASFATSLTSGRTLHGRSPRAILTAGLLLSGIGCALQAGLGEHSSAASLTLGLPVTGVGVGLLGPALGTAVFAALPPERSGMAAGAMTTFRQLGQTLGIAVFGMLFQQGSNAYDGLNRVLIAAAAAGFLGAVVACVFAPRGGTEGGTERREAAQPAPSSTADGDGGAAWSGKRDA
ncbi:MFS transporter [Kitasatospora kifunensis]|uniref:EmrB/QacA subfamily drug resistance transporter n=1 Tax=Kitasatospora kifunensis TaxID=58351 RepID=A0A7W7QWV1_KITKI|nr:MFS transporter [Kitasatospora kifunensis]MBB4921280.1 EmrB/QacA subfamily drug resistance transporter [Kitasatospora kifunensis]